MFWQVLQDVVWNGRQEADVHNLHGHNNIYRRDCICRSQAISGISSVDSLDIHKLHGRTPRLFPPIPIQARGPDKGFPSACPQTTPKISPGYPARIYDKWKWYLCKTFSQFMNLHI